MCCIADSPAAEAKPDVREAAVNAEAGLPGIA
jgi:hypothetical protein